jgi:hypothetical protein
MQTSTPLAIAMRSFASLRMTTGSNGKSRCATSPASLGRKMSLA